MPSFQSSQVDHFLECSIGDQSIDRHDLICYGGAPIVSNLFFNSAFFIVMTILCEDWVNHFLRSDWTDYRLEGCASTHR